VPLQNSCSWRRRSVAKSSFTLSGNRTVADSGLYSFCLLLSTGFGLGAVFTLFTSAMAYDTPYNRPELAPASGAPIRTQAAAMFKDMGYSMYRQGRSFGRLGAYFSGCECVIEGVSIACFVLHS
jgi:hypothetical protein